jgi:hypothetical protein
MTLQPAAPRTRNHRARLAALFLTAGFVMVVAGCDPRQAMFFLRPFQPKIPAQCDALKGKKVVILTSATAGLRTDHLNIDREIARRLAKILREKIKKIEIQDQAEVYAWVEGKPTWTDPAEAGRAFDADVVVYLEVREFQTQSASSPGLFEGRANVAVSVTEFEHPKDSRGKPMTDQPKESRTIFEHTFAPAFPVTGPVPAEASVNSAVFKERFLQVVVNELSWAFVEREPGDNIQNTRFDQ